MTATLAALLLGPVLAVPLAPPATAAAVETCLGLPATIVGVPTDSLIKGTAGPDVIVTNGVTAVISYAGADTVCVTGTDPGYADYVYVNTGPGDDRVDGTPDPHETRVELGPGNDAFTGGPGTDTVLAAEPGPAAQDVVATGAGDDSVSADDDLVDLGEGDDAVTLDPRSPRIDVHGGAGVDALDVLALEGRGWVVDNLTGVGRRAGRTWARWTGLERFRLDGSGSVRFAGGAGQEHVEVWTNTTNGVAMGAGDDTAVVVSEHLADGAAFTGGAGHDRLATSPYRTRTAPQAVHVDLASGRLRYSFDAAGAESAPVHRFEDASASAARARVTGDAAANRLWVSSCNGEASGRGGDDVIRWRRELRKCGRAGRPLPHILLSGDNGDDRLAGGRYDDVLHGGAGHDVARGKAGTDRCSAEETLSCELAAP